MTGTEPVVEQEERIGKYRVHPVAAMFPLMEGGAYETFKGYIEEYGLLEPIIVQDDVLIDGRNRLRACLELGIEPVVEEWVPRRRERYSSKELYQTVESFICSMNIQRRQLTAEQRSSVMAKVRAWSREQRAEQARLRKVEGGQKAGRGRPEQVNPNSDYPIADHNARSAAGQLAAEAKTMRYKAAQALKVADLAPEELDAVIAGTQTLREAAKKAIAKAPRKAAQPPAIQSGYLGVKARLIHRIRYVMKTYPSMHVDLRKAITEALDQERERKL